MAVTNLPDWLGQLLFGLRHWLNDGAMVNDSDTTNAVPPIMATWNPTTGKIDLSLSSVIPVGAVTVGPETWTSGSIAPTTDGGIVNLLAAPLTVPASGTLRVEMIVEAKLLSYAHTYAPTWAFATKLKRDGSGGPVGLYGNVLTGETGVDVPFSRVDGPTSTIGISGAADNGSGLIRLTLSGAQAFLRTGASGTVAAVGGVPNATGTWGLVVVDSTHVDLVGSTWAGTYTSGGTVMIGGVALAFPTISGNTAQLQAGGIYPPLWVTGEAVPAGAVRYAAGSGNTYVYTSAGTTSASPTGTTTGSDSGLLYDFHSTGRVCNVSWRITEIRYATT